MEFNEIQWNSTEFNRIQKMLCFLSFADVCTGGVSDPDGTINGTNLTANTVYTPPTTTNGNCTPILVNGNYVHHVHLLFKAHR